MRLTLYLDDAKVDASAIKNAQSSVDIWVFREGSVGRDL